MDYVQLGRTGLKVSRLCLGTMNFGPVTARADAHAIMDQAHAEGINFFDSANVYGWGENRGLTEQIVGEWFALGGGRREKTVLATKLYGDMCSWPNDGKLSALNIRRACDALLNRWQADYIDFYQMNFQNTNPKGNGTYLGFFTLDTHANLYFTPAGSVVPEPRTYAIAGGLGLLAFAAWRRRATK